MENTPKKGKYRWIVFKKGADQKIKGFREKSISPMLNQESDEEYELLWNQAQSTTRKSAAALPKNVFDFGTRNLAVV